MRKLLTIIPLLFSANIFAQTPTANAGNDITIYLTQGDSVTLNGTATNRNTSLWREVSTDYSSGATITNSTSLNATVSGLPQGVFYFELAVTSATSVVKKDTVMVTVDHDPPPVNSTLIRWFDFKGAAQVVNNRNDTTHYFSISDNNYGQITLLPNKYYFFRDRSNGLFIDSQFGKLVSTIQDGYMSTEGYPRAEVSIADNNFLLDTNHVYLFEWKGYFPQNVNYLTGWYSILTMFQIHGKIEVANPFGLNLYADNSIKVTDYFNGSYTLTPVTSLGEFYNNTHTLRVTVKEGKQGFLKVEIDGKQRYYRAGFVGSASFDDYVKFGGLYDWNQAMVSGSQLSRGRKYELITEAFNVYELSDTVAVAAPIPAGINNYSIVQNIANWTGWGHSLYEIQQGRDSLNWQTIGTVSGQIALNNYQYNLPAVNYYYRVKADKDSTKAILVSEVLSIKNPPPSKGKGKIKNLSAKVMVTDKIHYEIESPQSQEMQYSLYDITGRKLHEKVVLLHEGTNDVFDSKPTVKGIYIGLFEGYFNEPISLKINNQ